MEKRLEGRTVIVTGGASTFVNGTALEISGGASL